NHADQLVWQTEKLLSEQGDKVNEDEKKKINDSLSALKSALGNESTPTEEIREKHDELIKASQEFAQRIYAAAQAEGMSDAGADSSTSDFAGPDASDDVAEAEVVEDEPETSNDVPEEPSTSSESEDSVDENKESE